MTPKEKAEELYLKYRTLNLSTWINSEDAKKMSLIAVDLIIYHTEQDSSNIPLYKFYLEVKQEIEKL